MRSAGLGYFAGGGDDSACKSLQTDLLNDGAYCDNDGAFFPLAILNPLNKHEFGKTVRLGGDGFINPLMDRYVYLILITGLKPVIKVFIHVCIDISDLSGQLIQMPCNIPASNSVI